MASAIGKGTKLHSSQSQFLINPPDANVMEDKKESSLGVFSVAFRLWPLLVIMALK
jgi:hypothetical protein